MKSISDFSTSNAGAILLIGPPGVGKTTLCTQLDAVYILHTDDNLNGPIQAIKKSNGVLKADFKYDIPFFDAVNKPIPRPLRYQHCMKLAVAAINDPSIKTIVFELTSLVDILLDEVRRQQGWKMANNVTDFEDGKFEIQGWGAFAALLKNLIIQFKSTKKLIIFTAHVETKDDISDDSKDAKNKKHYKYIACPGQLRETISGYFDEVWFMENEERTTSAGIAQCRTLRTFPSGWREASLGLKSARQIGRKIDLDIPTIQKAIAQ